MKTITLCGSIKFKEDMMITAQLLAYQGNCIFTPVFPILDINLTDNEIIKLKEAHLKKIELSDAIVVINKDNYIGYSTQLEIEYAKELNKETLYYNDLFDIEQIKRIIKYEKLFDEISSNIDNNIDDKVKQLEIYYENEEWKKDYEDDEKGLIPNIIKRGILSEDGIYNLLENYYNKE